MSSHPAPFLQGGANPLPTLSEVARELRCSKAHVQNIINGKVPNVPPFAVLGIGKDPGKFTDVTAALMGQYPRHCFITSRCRKIKRAASREPSRIFRGDLSPWRISLPG
jgi:hypothetical protein